MRAHAGLVLAIALSSFLLVPPPVSAQIDKGVQLDRGLAEIESGRPVPLRNRPMPSRGRTLDRNTGRRTAHAPRDYVEPAEFGVILEFDGSRAELEAAGIRVGTQTGRIFTARVRRAEIGRLRGLSGMRRVQLARYMQPHLNVSRVDVGADVVNGGSGSPPVYSGRAGQGIIIGDVDTGIDFTRPDFQDSTGKTRILYIWDQNDEAGPGPAGFSYGSEWTKSQIDDTPGAIRHQDTNGHGTSVAGVLIGNGSETGCSQPAYRHVGMAPLAEFIEVATDMSDAGIIDGVNYIFQKAAALGKDCVVNLSLGGQAGPHDGSDDFGTAINALTGPGRIVVASAGNDQQDRIHGRLTTTSTVVGTDYLRFSLPAYTFNAGAVNDYILIAGWYDPTASVVIQVRGPLAGDTLSCGLGNWSTRSTGTTGFQIYIANQADGFEGTATARQFEIEIWDATTNQRPRSGVWNVRIVSNDSASIGKRADMWIYASQLGSIGVVPVVTTGLDNTTLVGQPADADSIFAVAAHVTKPSWYSCGDATTWSFTGATMNAIAGFSNVGPRRDGVLKPEISAPGFGVATTHSSFAGSLTGTGYDVEDGVHEISAGTSFSAPHVAGAAALFLQANPGASPSKVKLAFQAHARADAYTGTVPNATWGYGKLDIYAAIGSADLINPSVTVTVPNTSVTWKAGSTHAITWTATDNVGVTAVDLAYSTDGGVSYPNVIATGLANSGSYSWTVPNSPGSTARVRATAHDAAGNTASDASDADFTIDRWTITASAGPGGNIAPVGLVPVVEGANQEFSIQATGGNHVLDVLVDGLSVGSDTTYTFTSVTADHSIAASFAADLFTLTSTAATGGAVTRAPDLTGYPYGTDVTVTAVPDSGWAFTGWSGDTTTTGNPLALLMIANRSVAAAFADTAPPAVHVLAPVGGTVATIDEQTSLAWNAFDNAAVVRVDLYLSRTGAGGAFDSIATAVPNTGSYDWLVTGPATVDAFLKVVARDSAGNVGADVSDSSFVIRATAGVGDRPVADFELAPMQPNPLRGVGSIGFALPSASHVRLSVIDVQGREVAVLAEGVYGAGRHQARWEGATSGRVGPGLYFVRLSVAGRSLVRRAVVTR